MLLLVFVLVSLDDGRLRFVAIQLFGGAVGHAVWVFGICLRDQPVELSLDNVTAAVALVVGVMVLGVVLILLLTPVAFKSRSLYRKR